MLFLRSRRWFVLCLASITYPVLVLVSGDRDWLYRFGPPENGDRIQSAKHCIFNKDRIMDNVQKYGVTDLLKTLSYGARRTHCWVNIFPTQSTIELRLLSSKRINKNVFVTMNE
jgi:hypothetical protein